ECPMTFDKRSQRDNHKRVDHQQSATVTDMHGGEWEVMRQGGVYHCPVGNYITGMPSPAHPRLNELLTCPSVSDVLTEYGLVWNASCRILICVQCNKGVPPSEVATHRNHDLNRTVAKRSDVLRDLDEYVQQAVPPTPPVLPPGYVLGVPCEPIEGLKIYHGFACQICHAAFPAKNSMKEHFREKHIGQSSLFILVYHLTDVSCTDQYKNRSLHMIATKCQQIYSHNLRLYFSVLPHQARPHVVLPGLEAPRSPSPQAAPRSEAVKILSKKFDLHVAQSNLTPSTTSDNQLSNWLYVSGIHHYMTDLIKKGKSIQQLMTPAEDLPPVLAMAPFIAHWINTTMKRLHQTGQFLKRHCMAETTSVLNTSFSLLTHSDLDVEDNKGLMPLQEKSSVDKYATTIARLMWFMIEESENKVDENTQLYNIHIVMLKDLKAAIETVTPVVQEQGDNTDIHIQDPETHDPISPHVSLILCSIFQLYCSAADCQYWLPALQFLARSMLKANGSYDRPDNFTRLIAHIQYGVRMAFAEQFMDKAAERGPFDPSADPRRPSSDDFSKFDFLHKNKSAPFNIMRQLMHLATTIYMSETMPDSTFWADHHQETLEINNKTVTISGIRSCIQYHDKMAQAKLHEIVKGCKLPPFDPALYSDKPNNTAPGFNYLVHSELTHKKYTLHLLKEWAAKKDVHGLMQDTWLSKFDDDTPAADPDLWNHAALWNWLAKVDKLMETLYFLYHVASVAPRSLYMRSLVFAVLSYYHKGRNMTGQNKPRMTFLTEAHSVLWHYWNAYIRPAAVFALQVLNEPERAQQMATYVWVHSEKGVLDTDDFSLILQRLFHEGGVAKLGVRNWRQASVAIVDAHIKLDPTSVNETSIFEAQRGHSGKTANMHYAGTGGYDIDRNSETRYRAASHAMHKFWGV
ncbi:hypothetical protein DFH28DRAFT_830153, partial [Melampsora americana]